MKDFLKMLGVAIVSVGIFIVGQGTSLQDTFRGVTVGNDYVATSTAANAHAGAFLTSRLLKTGYGSLGSLVITGANTGSICFYNATTSSVLLRASSKATSTIHLGCTSPSTGAGTYVFDATFTDGLYADIQGTAPTTTITYR